jgi:hypothetical protein
MTDRRAERAPSAFRLNLEQQKNRAKDLLRAAKAGDIEALSRLEAVRPNSVASSSADARQSTVKLADAQLVIARDLRFASWAKLKAHIESMEGQRTAITRKLPPLDGELKTLHIRCGHDIQNTLMEAGFVGDYLVHAIPYCVGPVTKGPERYELMARFLARWLQDEQVYRRELEGLPNGEMRLHRTADDYERVVIWMEHDNYDQLVLARLLAHYASAKRPRILELIVLNDFPGAQRFVGLGQLPPEALRLLWPTRKPVTSAQLALGTEVWDALASDDPRNLAALARSGTPALPIMAPALHLHLRELPSVENGLRLTEQLILQIVSESAAAAPMRAWGDVWPLLKKRESICWVTDTHFRDVINYILAVSEPVMTFTRDPPLPGHTSVETPGRFLQLLAITELGRAVLRGERDWLSLRPQPRWVGGVHIQPGGAGWRWDEAKRDAVFR